MHLLLAVLLVLYVLLDAQLALLELSISVMVHALQILQLDVLL
jgi:hypothetical protein